MFKFKGEFEKTAIYETKLFGKGTGLTIPGIGIIVGEEIFSKNKDPWLIKHEYGHILQKAKYGHFKFYTQIAIKSLCSAAKQSIFNHHQHAFHPVEIAANQLAYEYFNQPKDWPVKRFPLSAV
ncbi:hypothetical protein [Pedobacter cryophilus]|uniref:DUF4157 domain-containing protein n=1 Tax=Pedobacter cryophilus TaxID=2571271 RepID=A0A4V5NXA8_9SPHI|nr:hypothetical protein [Pedobacter cryophilus]TKB97927.1 hypothetical protein FA046_11320 [Pedobacter cryophilus]